MVNVYLNIDDKFSHSPSRSIDIERLSVRPAKWLQFITFAICGVRGDLSATPYYYISEGICPYI
jgi:hypothetical protein